MPETTESHDDPIISDLTEAWTLVQKAGLPKELHQTAFQYALSGGGSSRASTKASPTTSTRKKASPGKEAQTASAAAAKTVDEATFFKNLSDESGQSEQDLRDIIYLTDGMVQVQRPTRELGSSKAEQSRTVIALVAGARAYGLGESPVSAGEVRSEVERKRCFDPKNYAVKHLGGMQGYNAGAKGEIRVTSKWVEEFDQAVSKILKPANE